MFSFNLPVDGLMENKKAVMKELLRIYPHGDLTKTKYERDFRCNTPIGDQRSNKQEYRPSDIYTKVKGVPRRPFIPSYIPKLGQEGSDIEVITSSQGNNSSKGSRSIRVISREELSKNNEDWIKE